MHRLVSRILAAIPKQLAHCDGDGSLLPSSGKSKDFKPQTILWIDFKISNPPDPRWVFWRHKPEEAELLTSSFEEKQEEEICSALPPNGHRMRSAAAQPQPTTQKKGAKPHPFCQGSKRKKRLTKTTSRKMLFKSIMKISDHPNMFLNPG